MEKKFEFFSFFKKKICEKKFQNSKFDIMIQKKNEKKTNA